MSSSPFSTSRALIVEDLPVVRRGLARILARAFPGISVDEATDVASARLLLDGPGKWHIALVDLGLPDGSGIDLIPLIRQTRPTTTCIVTTIYNDDEHLFAALSAGAEGYLLKEEPADVLVDHLQKIDQGIPPLSPAIARRMLTRLQQAPVPSPRSADTFEPSLTPRETEVLSLVARGMRRHEVAQMLSLSEHTVARYLKDLYRKLHIGSRAEAALEASRRGLV